MRLEAPIRTSLVVSLHIAKHEALDVAEKLLLPSIYQNASGWLEVIIVDDCSPMEKETESLISRYREELIPKAGEFKHIKNKKRLGIGGSYNRGIQTTDGKVIIIANSDVYFPKNSLASLSTNTLAGQDVGAVGPVTNSTWSYQNTSLFPKLKNYSEEELTKIEKFAAWLRKVMGGQTCKIVGNMGDIFGFCMSFSRDIIREVGDFDPRFKMGYFEDTDLNRRIRKAGYSIILDKSTFVEHGGVTGASVSFNQYPIESTIAKLRNAWEYAKKWNCYIELPFELIRDASQGNDRHTVTDEIVITAKEKGLWEEYLQIGIK